MRVLVSAQDPGGANAVAPVAEALMRRGDEVVARVEGAARGIFAARGIPSGSSSDPAVVLLGTSGEESIEKRITTEMRGKAPIVAVLDYWANYWQRFSNPGIKDFAYLPDVVCVMDEVAKEEMVAEGFPPEVITVTGNPAFDHFADGITREHEDPKHILFISQPLRLDGQVPGFAAPIWDEYAVLETLRDALPVSCTLFIRLHPRDAVGKYDRYLNTRIRLAPEATLEEALSASGLVVGTSSHVLLQAAAAGKKVLSYEPALTGPDEMVSNRTGVTIRIESPQELTEALKAYADGKWSYTTRPLREVWPAGATERVIEQVLTIAHQ